MLSVLGHLISAFYTVAIGADVLDVHLGYEEGILKLALVACS